jgi:hypothetical protein
MIVKFSLSGKELAVLKKELLPVKPDKYFNQLRLVDITESENSHTVSIELDGSPLSIAMVFFLGMAVRRLSVIG